MDAVVNSSLVAPPGLVIPSKAARGMCQASLFVFQGLGQRPKTPGAGFQALAPLQARGASAPRRNGPDPREARKE